MDIALPTIDQWVMIGLTLIIATSAAVQATTARQQSRDARKQAEYAQEQARPFAESEARHREREQPTIKITSGHWNDTRIARGFRLFTEARGATLRPEPGVVFGG